MSRISVMNCLLTIPFALKDPYWSQNTEIIRHHISSMFHLRNDGTTFYQLCMFVAMCMHGVNFRVYIPLLPVQILYFYQIHQFIQIQHDHC